MISSSQRPLPWWLKVSVGVWGVLVICGLAGLLRYYSLPGGLGEPPDHWPTGTTLEFPANEPCLVMFAHPRCPCTRASLRQLDGILEETAKPLKTYVVFIQPTGVTEAWLSGDVVDSALANQRIDVRFDNNLMLTRMFGIETSGHTLLYDPTGGLVFSGGITQGRGRAGDNPGCDQLRQCFAGMHQHDWRLGAIKHFNVYGCSLSTVEER